MPRSEEGASARQTQRDALTVLLAEDDAELRSVLSRELRARGFIVHDVSDGRAALSSVLHDFDLTGSDREFDVLISDIHLPVFTGLDLLRAMRSVGCRPLKIIMITAFGSVGLHLEARRLGATAVLDKPFEFSALHALLNEVVRE